MSEIITLIAKPPIEGEDAECYKCGSDEMTKTDGHRDNHNLWFCEECGVTRWILDTEVKQQQEWERYWLERIYGVSNPRSIREYWHKPQLPLTANRGAR